MNECDIEFLIDRRVVLDTSGTMIYIGKLVRIRDAGYWLADADVHDRSDGHSTKEQYVNEAHELARSGSLRTRRIGIPSTAAMRRCASATSRVRASSAARWRC